MIQNRDLKNGIQEKRAKNKNSLHELRAGLMKTQRMLNDAIQKVIKIINDVDRYSKTCNQCYLFNILLSQRYSSSTIIGYNKVIGFLQNT